MWHLCWQFAAPRTGPGWPVPARQGVGPSRRPQKASWSNSYLSNRIQIRESNDHKKSSVCPVMPLVIFSMHMKKYKDRKWLEKRSLKIWRHVTTFGSFRILEDGCRHMVHSMAPHGPTSSHDRPGPLKQRPPDGTRRSCEDIMWSLQSMKASQDVPSILDVMLIIIQSNHPAQERKITTMSAEPSAVSAPVDRRRTCHRRGCEPLHLRQGFGSWFPWPSQVNPKSVWVKWSQAR